MSEEKRNVIIVTDGDNVALRTVETAAANIGGRCISLSAGNPSWISGPNLVKLIESTPYDPVVLMVDDNGKQGPGKGEKLLSYIADHDNIRVLGAIAVASNSSKSDGIMPDCCINCDGIVTSSPVDKFGNEKTESGSLLTGDTAEVLNTINLPVVIGIGDIGKMDGKDDYKSKAPLTTMAMRMILERSGFNEPVRY
ncbi:MAG: stage V sporulation protein AE [Clostridiales bacterium]|nr:stage V sporulation protein AE [Clostridiales bacterium]MCF8021234.1 stage V sporulation protein AE [Clostridiales bacterium]